MAGFAGEAEGLLPNCFHISNMFASSLMCKTMYLEQLQGRHIDYQLDRILYLQ